MPPPPVRFLDRIDWVSKGRHAAMVWAFCVAVVALQLGFMPERAFGPPLVYSLAIGSLTWALVDFGRHAFASSTETGWPPGLTGVALVAASIAVGYLGGTALGDLLCRTFGLTSGPPPDPREGTRALLISVTAGVVGSYYFYSHNRAAWLRRRMVEAQAHATEARLKLLQAQLEPHMLFNTLATLRALIGTDPARAQAMLDHMNDYLRATLGASRATSHTLADEFARLADYLALMAIRMGPRLTYTLDLPEALGSRPVPALLLQPLVENSIRHGLEPKVAGGHIRVRASTEADQLVLAVEDDGVGTGDSAAAASQAATGAGPGGTGSFGLAQVRERLAALYGTAATIELVAAPAGGMRSTLRFPSNA